MEEPSPEGAVPIAGLVGRKALSARPRHHVAIA